MNENTKALIIEWKWSREDLDKSPLKIESDNHSYIYMFNNNSSQGTEDLAEFVNSHKFDNAIILLHKTEPNYFKDSHVELLNKKINNQVVKIYLFELGDDEVYHKTGIDTSGLLNQSGSFYDEDEYSVLVKKAEIMVKKVNFEYVWNYYWNELELQELKKKITNVCLPIAIDIIGLGQVEKHKREVYIDEIKTDITAYSKEFREVLEAIYNLFFPEKLPNVMSGKEIKARYVLEANKKKDIIFPIETNSITDNSLMNFIEENSKLSADHAKFFPNWLKRVIAIMDESIEQQ